MNEIWIGVDPDIQLNGIAVWTKDSLLPKGKLRIEKKSFFELYEFLFVLRHNYPTRIKVVIEAGWLNTKSNWHVSGKGENVSARIGTKVGANHQVGKLIVEMCEYLGLEYQLSQPKTSKMGIRQFRKLTKYEGKLDQDGVDAALLVWQR